MTTEAKKEEIFEQISFTKPGTGNRFLFCSICAIVKRSDTISPQNPKTPNFEL
jgi:hypothetical protein